MACNCTTEEGFQEMEKELSIKTLSQSSQQLTDSQEKIDLNRGGWVIDTSIGNIQYGIPPETVKDCINQGVKVPSYYIVPSQMFDKKFGLNFCEFEFPAYFNFFVKKNKIFLICTKEEEEKIRIIFQETLLGPKNFDDFQDDFSRNYDKDKIPDIKKELENFAKNPFNPKEPLKLELLIDFITLDTEGKANISEKVQVQKINGNIIITDDGKQLIKEKDRPAIKLMGDEKKEYKKYGLFNNPHILDQSQVHSDGDILVSEIPINSNFKPPAFGITLLGSSHGFDPNGSTSGYILWINGRGLMIDPPAFSTIKLKQMGIPFYLIGWIFISHCHADHDCGALQQILGSQKIELITTKTIMKSFVRKYSAITGLNEKNLKSLFTFKQALVGTPCKINGANLEIFYSLHSIPCLGFICKYQDKSIYFSGDTFYDPENLKLKWYDTGILKKGRYEELISHDFKFKHDIIIHEAGVPPIHTPMSVLKDLPADVKHSLLIVHSSVKDLPKNVGLKIGKTGLENTYIILGDNFMDNNPELFILKRLNLISNITIFENIPLKSVRDLLDSLQVKKYKKGELIIKEGQVGEDFFIVEEGVCKIQSQQKQFQIFYHIGDYFGESALYNNGQHLRMANVEAYEDCSILVLNKQDFNFIFSENSEIYQKLHNLLLSRQNIAFEQVQHNSFLSQLNSTQKIQFEMILTLSTIKKGEYIMKKGEVVQFAFLTGQQGLQIINDQENIEIQEGVLVADTNSIFNQELAAKTIQASQDVIGFKIKKQDFINFLTNNPGFYLYAMGKLLII